MSIDIDSISYNRRRYIGDFWHRLKNYLNTELIGVEVMRKSILQDLGVNSHYTTLDCYLNYLHKAGYLYKPRRGWYGLAVTIPTDLSVDDCRSEAYGIIDQDGIRRVLNPVERNEARILAIKKEQEFFEEEEFNL